MLSGRRPVDKRADIWAFGCVLYEMLTGTRAFPGDNITDTMAAVVRAEPDWRALPADLGIPNVLGERRGSNGTSATVTVRDPSPALAGDLTRRLDAHVEIEGLGLEDIFLEIHS